MNAVGIIARATLISDAQIVIRSSVVLQTLSWYYLWFLFPGPLDFFKAERASFIKILVVVLIDIVQLFPGKDACLFNFVPCLQLTCHDYFVFQFFGHYLRLIELEFNPQLSLPCHYHSG